ncbi:MAG: helix-turn-helix domain-containing protein [Acidobacteriota bacterium]|nr:MAG: helix-turn-helix domain-containing protein [Acidobacteriota bacterium]
MKTRPKRIDAAKYGQLLADTLPAVINSDAEYDRLVSIMNKLAVIPDDRISPEQERLLEILTLLVEKYDDEQYPIPVAPPHEVIRFLMQDRGLRNRDLEPLLGSRGVTSEVISGKRNPSKTQIRKLAEFFNVPPETFLSLEYEEKGE